MESVCYSRKLLFYLVISALLLITNVSAAANVKPAHNFSNSQIRRDYVNRLAEKQKKAKQRAVGWAMQHGYPVRVDDGKRHFILYDRQAY